VNELRGIKLGGCELQEEIGQGGMGFIYRARQLSLDRVVAVKILADHLAHNPSFVERFQREARAIAKVNHPNILAVYDVGQQQGRHYMIMELVDGGSLAELLEKRGILDPGEAAQLITQAARGLACAADSNIIHRDVKPDNIMLTSQHVVKVSDFGLAKELDSTMTETQAVMGTPAYMSPEQCDGLHLDSRTDMYSLGGTFYRCVTGRLPFDADTAMSMMYRHKHVPLTPPHKIVPTLPESLSEVICRMMAKDRDDRYANMTEVAEAIERAKEDKPAFDPGRTVPMAPSEPEPQPEPPSDAPAFMTSDTRVVAETKSPQEIADTQVRCRESATRLRAEGKLAQAARELRRLLEVSPDDADAKKELRELEKLLSDKRLANGEIRSLVASSHYEEALEKWNALGEEMRDEQIAAQMERLSTTVVPSLKLVAAADAQVEAGELDDAIQKYEEALKLDPSSEKAKQGVKNVERTRQRIQILLKDGYTHRQNRDYKQAVEVWGKIIHVDPGNAQARRLICEARMAAANEAFNNEDFSRAAKQCETILKLDPKHEAAGRMIAEAIVNRDRVDELRKAAEMARGRGDLSGSIKAYRELTNLIPKSKVAREGLDSTRRELSKGRVKRLLVILFLLIVGVAGWFGYQDWQNYRRAVAAMQSGDFGEAVEYARKVRVLFKEAADKIAQRAAIQELLSRSRQAADAGKWEVAIKALEEALRLRPSPAETVNFTREKSRYTYYWKVQLAAAAEDRDDWDQAKQHHLGAKNAASEADLPDRASQAEVDYKYCELVSLGMKALGRGETLEAKNYFRSALNWRSPGSEKARRAVEELRKLGVKVN
jgi:serine/threonine protein kinase/predicted negative regulator of RcsB-dependent stress response